MELFFGSRRNTYSSYSKYPSTSSLEDNPPYEYQPSLSSSLTTPTEPDQNRHVRPNHSNRSANVQQLEGGCYSSLEDNTTCTHDASHLLISGSKIGWNQFQYQYQDSVTGLSSQHLNHHPSHNLWRRIRWLVLASITMMGCYSMTRMFSHGKSHMIRPDYKTDSTQKDPIRDLHTFLLHGHPMTAAAKTSSTAFPLDTNEILHHSLFAFTGFSSFQGSTVTPRPLIYLNHPEAYQLLLDSTNPSSSNNPASFSPYSTDFFLLYSGLDAQINQAYCGPASVAALLNSLRFLGSSTRSVGVDIPVDTAYAPYSYATQDDIFNACTAGTVIDHVNGGSGVNGLLMPPFGLSMIQVANILACHLNTTVTTLPGNGNGGSSISTGSSLYGGGSSSGSSNSNTANSASNGNSDWTIEIHYADATHLTVNKMRFDIKAALADANSRVLVNYDRATVGQMGGAHWSPVGSFSEKNDAFLILDVAKYKYPPVWIPTERLFDAMATNDDCGFWNFPKGQEVLNSEERLGLNDRSYESAKTKLLCESRVRGYIIVSLKA